jgi:uncharacterized membrane protein
MPGKTNVKRGGNYNIFSGDSLDRLAALSDGIFAVAMTLLVLDLRIPARELVHSEHDLIVAFWRLAPQLITYVMSFLTLGIFWVGQQTQLNRFGRGDRNLAWIQLGFLLAVTILPFSTALLSAYLTFRFALIVYWFNIFLIGAAVLASIRYAICAKLITGDDPGRFAYLVQRRIIVAQALYFAGMLLCFINTYVSIAFIVLVQLNFAIAPRIGRLSEI